MHDELPSQEDIERFSSEETGFCQRCGEEVWENASQCPSCGTWLRNGTSHRDPISNDFRKKMIFLIIVIMIIGFVYSALRLFEKAQS